MDANRHSADSNGDELLFARQAYDLMQKGDLEEARRKCEQGLKKFPTYATAHYVLARCYMKQNRPDEARAEYERVLRYDPNHLKTLRDLAGIHFANGFQDLYKDYLKKLYILDPLNQDVVNEAKKLGEFDFWQASFKQDESKSHRGGKRPDKAEQSAADDALFIHQESAETESQAASSGQKLDLSQFDNLEDDFTTILHGKLDYPAVPLEPASSETESDKDQNDMLTPNVIDGKKEPGKSDDIVETMDELVGEDEEIMVSSDKESNEPEEAQSKARQFAEKTSVSFDTQSTSDNSESTESVSASPEKRDDSKHLPDQKKIMEESLKEIEASLPAVAPTEDKKESGMESDLAEEKDEEKFEQPKIITQTLGEILVSQKKYAEAKSVFEALKKKEPNNKSLDVKLAFLDKIIGLEKKLKSE